MALRVVAVEPFPQAAAAVSLAVAVIPAPQALLQPINPASDYYKMLRVFQCYMRTRRPTSFGFRSMAIASSAASTVSLTHKIKVLRETTGAPMVECKSVLGMFDTC